MNKTLKSSFIFSILNRIWLFFQKSYLLQIDFSIKTKDLKEDHIPYNSTYIIRQLNIVFTKLYHFVAKVLFKPINMYFESLINRFENLTVVKSLYSLLRKSLILSNLRHSLENKRDFLIILPGFYLFIDYTLRTTTPLTFISSTWDELLMLVLIWLYISKEDLNPLSSENADKLKVFLYLYLFSGLIGFFYTMSDVKVSIDGFRSVYQYILWFFIILWLVKKEKQFDLLDNTLAFSGLFLGLHGVYQYIAGVEMLGNWVDSTEHIRTRAFSIMYNPNALGAILVLLIPIVLSKLLTSKNTWNRIYLTVSLFSMTLSLLFTMSRGAWLGFILSLCVFLIFINKKLIVHFALLGIGSFFAFDFVSERVLYMLSKEYLFRIADGGRVSKWLEAFDVWSQNKIFGAGYGHFGSAVAVKYNISTTYVDGYFVKLLAETGLWGLLSFLLLTLGIIYLILKSITYESNVQRKIMKIGYGASAIAVLAQCSVESLLEIPVIATYFWIILGMFFALDNINYKEFKTYKETLK